MTQSTNGPLRKNVWFTSPVFKLALTVAALLVVSSGYSSAKCLGQEDPVGALGIINSKGDWIVPAMYEQIIYIKKIDSYWVKQRPLALPESGPLAEMLHCFAKNNSWKLLNRNGEAVDFALPYSCDPLDDSDALQALKLIPYEPPQAPGVAVYADQMLISDTGGLGLSDPYGHPLTPCIYSEIHDAGEGLFLAKEPYREPLLKKLDQMIFGPSYSSSEAQEAPPFVLIDEHGSLVATLPSNVMRARRKFVNGLLPCDFCHRTLGCVPGAVDRTGRVVIQPGGKMPASLIEPIVPSHKINRLDYVYAVPSSADHSIRFQKESELSHSELLGKSPQYYAPMATEDDNALVFIRPEEGAQLLTGMVDNNGNWLIKPEYDRLAYPGPDRLAASKDHLTLLQLQMRRSKFCQTRIVR